ncbi:anti-sigma factor domain-containing protein [Palleronia sp. LCG004]|uniref:anti-sigma factor n=1 Tax=Palleronia sp. LCG004 TaxID=3079304 RepID=UPI002943BAD1|nr:anti-sigma factor [Palleronia sp. LCG004]WOI55305.1 anti-sigma factor [Palleronia sp. LCG004]
MSSDRIDRSGDGPVDDMLAAEYVLHLLSVNERVRFENRLDVEGGLRARVQAWSERLAPMADEIAPVEPPAHVRARLAEFVKGTDRARVTRSRFSMSQMMRGMFGGALVAVAALVLLAVMLPVVQPPHDGPIYAADLSTEDGLVAVQARFDPREDVLVLESLNVEAPEGRVLQLWLLPDGAEVPLSLGLLPQAREIVVELAPDAAAGIPGGLLEISEEPPGGSPRAGPTGNVLAIGEVQQG